MKYEAGYPVTITAGGDTVQGAFEKYNEETTRIYGILNELNDADLTPEEIDRLKNGEIEASRITGNLDGAHITGTLLNATIYGSKVTGALNDSVTIAAGKVTGLTDFVNNAIGNGEATGLKLTASNPITPGYVKLSNGLMFQWGNSGYIFRNGTTAQVTFPYEFSTSCFLVLLTYKDPSEQKTGLCNVLSFTKDNFSCICRKWYTSSASGSNTTGSPTIEAAGYTEVVTQDPSDLGSVDFVAIGV